MSNPAANAAPPHAPSTTKSFTVLPDHSACKAIKPLPLPGVVILVHGVNSDGEWFEQTEKGLCIGLNRRLARQSDQLAHSGVENGQLGPIAYSPELTDSGYIRRRRNDTNFMLNTPACSPVIRFRWGYKASRKEMNELGENLYLNEQDYWGGGPFQNGCSAIADLWSQGLDDRLFLWIHAQHLNPVVGREAFKCPHRAYYVHAALRLAKLIQSIRTKQADCPITVVCHSQGNMVGIGAAFLADTLGVQADSYVLCNPPLSLLPDNFAEDWSQSTQYDHTGHTRGRVSAGSRIQTLKNYFELLRARQAKEQDATHVDEEMGNACEQGYSAKADRAKHGLNGHTYGRVTLYCNPHDQVISATTVQGIGWMGVSAEEIGKANGQGVFTQRVFAQGYKVGQAPGKSYHYWKDHWKQKELDAKYLEQCKSQQATQAKWSQRTVQSSRQSYGGTPITLTGTTATRYNSTAPNHPSFLDRPHPPASSHTTWPCTPGPKMDKADFWYPHSLQITYRVEQGAEANTSVAGKATTYRLFQLGYLVPLLMKALPESVGTVNAFPKDDWAIPIDAPALPEPFLPQSAHYNVKSDQFDQSFDAAGQARQSNKPTPQKDDPYDTHRTHKGKVNPGDDAPLGTDQSEAQLRYEDHAHLRMKARREGRVNSKGNLDEDNLDHASPDYKRWRGQEIEGFLRSGVDQVATDHSTIMTNPDHAEKALAYDVAIGVCSLTREDWHELRIEADWRYITGLELTHPHRYLSEYFVQGQMQGKPLQDWIQSGEAARPAKVVDVRENHANTPRGMAPQYYRNTGMKERS